MTGHLRPILCVALLVATPAAARTQSRKAPAPSIDSATHPGAPIEHLDGGKLSPGHWSYAIAVNIGQTRQDAGNRTLSLVPVQHDGRDAWLLVDIKGAGERSVEDSLYLSRAALSPLDQTVHLGDASVVSRFATDSAFFEVMVAQQPARFAMSMPRATMVNGAMLMMAMRLVPVTPGWVGHAEMLALSSTGAVTVPIDIHLEGEDVITVPAGTFHCWRFSQKTQGSEQRFWIDEKGRALVKLATTSDANPGMVAEMTLTGQG